MRIKEKDTGIMYDRYRININKDKKILIHMKKVMISIGIKNE
jgi:hypothetical protein